MKLFELEGGQLMERGTSVGIDRTTGGRSVIVLPGQRGLDVFAGNERGANFCLKIRATGRLRRLHRL